MDASEHDELRIDVTGFQAWDVIPTRLYIRATCVKDGQDIHTVISTVSNYLNLRLPDAIAKDSRNILRLPASEKLTNKPKRVRLVIHDYLTYLYFTKQITASTAAQKTWISDGWSQARKLGIPVRVELGTHDLKTEFRLFCENLCENSTITPTRLGTGDVYREFLKELEEGR